MKRLLGAAVMAAGLVSSALASSAIAPAAGQSAAGALQFAPLAMTTLIEKICRGAEKDGGDLTALAKSSGLGEPRDPPMDLVHALPDGARVWPAPSADGAVFLFGYGERPLKCGAAVLRPVPDIGFERALAQLQASGFAVDSTQALEGATHWTRLKASGGQFVDLMEYPAQDSSPSVLRADLIVD